MKFLSLLASSALAFASVNGEVVNYEVSKFSMADVAIHNDNTVNELKSALYTSGIVAVTDIEGFEKVQKAALSAFQYCADKEAIAVYELEDGASRSSVGAEVHGSSALPFEVPESCAAFAEASKVLQTHVSRVCDAFISSLDTVLGSKPVITRSGAEDIKYASLSHALMNANHLEHFHAYTASSKSNSDLSVELHTDNGILIAFTPGLFFDEGKVVDAAEDDMFYIQLANGEMVRAVLPRNSLVFMMGEAMSKLVDEKIRAVPHSLKVNPKHDQRMWFGRMFLPPADAIFHEDITFGEYRELVASGSASAAMRSIGCDGARELGSVQHRRELNGDENPNCTNVNGTSACWMACRAVVADGCSGDFEERCANDAGVFWVPGLEGGAECVAPDCINGTAIGPTGKNRCCKNGESRCVEPGVEPGDGSGAAASTNSVTTAAAVLLLSIVSVVV
uniref:Isopenicillin N synthase-like Fe(2+) 2OG dioxygenase domain-containing protein n=2 Tax=Sar TaxID=2698737 RepID=A0A7S3PKK6_9STRA|mmetsp:Transcript_15076/g.18640  ORF Transcript_15076/g.18640 Transcript_15076/m.18640 type:complete len:450 (+) Transcript_15076:61-1410(+)|eukprot:CAMPEP_0204827216 /NCGR_PEP_ID=MMETSP1346-20131115/4721_1 /ASSEMBLY_ACC=CAM_ASM_000771 /TAXON_ID=215587 /ORGANISM="Aplanochytrium stocchinoi, Strain GSBS06" /LENGTH=449 /DNA_ID=CAMNT_0051955565 /DNA_START=226 /DNA_END=1575 /DNA_ORIENTATION=-